MSDRLFKFLKCGDSDGLVCTMLLRKLSFINEIKFVHSKDNYLGFC